MRSFRRRSPWRTEPTSDSSGRVCGSPGGIWPARPTTRSSAIAFGAGAVALETAGWAAYYSRDFDAAQRYADEGAARAVDEAIRASCLALGGRTRHSRGELHEAEPRLVEAVTSPLAEVRGVAQVWLAALRAHQGETVEALDFAERALLEPGRFAHPFAAFHAQFARGLALGMHGRTADLQRSADLLESGALEAGDEARRFVLMAKNLRAWSIRSVGRTGEAIDLLQQVLAMSQGGEAGLAEPHHVAMLDLVEVRLDAGDVDGAATDLDAARMALSTWNGTMAWRARQRSRLLQSRLALATGDHADAERIANALAESAAQTGNRRHAMLAVCTTIEAVAVARDDVDHDGADRALARLDQCGRLESWRVSAHLAAAAGVDRWWAEADQRAARFVGAAGPLAEDAARYVGRVFSGLGRST